MVFLFIHVAKAIHKHERPGITFSFQLKVQKSSDCPICDYHIAKDGDLPVVLFSPAQNMLPGCYQIIPYQSQLISSIGLSYADRGPPVLA